MNQDIFFKIKINRFGVVLILHLEDQKVEIGQEILEK